MKDNINMTDDNNMTYNNNVCTVCLERKPEVNRRQGEHLCYGCMGRYEPLAVAVIEDMKNQKAKADAGKPILSLVPTEIIYEIEKVRSFGNKKYKDSNSWKGVEIERYHQALLRHTLAVWDDIASRDEESGLLHLSHIACNVAFLLEMLKGKEDGNV